MNKDIRLRRAISNPQSLVEQKEPRGLRDPRGRALF